MGSTLWVLWAVTTGWIVPPQWAQDLGHVAAYKVVHDEKMNHVRVRKPTAERDSMLTVATLDTLTHWQFRPHTVYVGVDSVVKR